MSSGSSDSVTRAQLRLFGLGLLPSLVLAAGLAASTVLWWTAIDRSERELREHFEDEAHEMAMRVQQRARAFEQVLRGASGLFSASDKVDSGEFARYIKALELEQNYAGIRSVGYVARVPLAEKARHAQARRKHGNPGFAIYPEGERALYTPIVYIEPQTTRNLRTRGYDAYSDAMRREAMERARDLGRPAVSGRLKLQQDDDASAPGFVMYAPVYSKGVLGDTVAERRAGTAGWVMFAFRMSDFVAGLHYAHEAGIGFDLVDAAAPGATLSAAANGEGARAAKPSQFTSSRRIEFGGRVWAVNARSLPDFEGKLDKVQAQTTLVIGLLLSLLLTMIVWLLVNGRERAQGLARELARELRESDLRWKFAVEGSGDGLWDWNLHEGKAYYSPRWKTMLGYAEDEIGDAVEENTSRVHPEDLAATADSLRAVLKGNAPIFQAEFRIRCKDGGWKWVLDRGIVIRNGQDAKPERMIGTRTDMTERRLIEEKLRSNEARYRALAESSNDAVVTSDADGRIVGWNTAAERMFGYAQAEVLGQDMDMLMPQTFCAQHVGAVKRMLVSGERHAIGKIYEREGLRKDGSACSLEVSLAEWTYSGSRFVTASIRDISERKRDETALLEYRQHLEEMVQERTNQLRALTLELLTSEARERRVIAEDLHDGLGQSLAVAKLKLTSLVVPSAGAGADEFLRQLKDLEDTIDRCNTTVRSLSTQLSPPVLYQFGLGPALEWLSDEMMRTYGLGVELSLGELPALDESTSSALFRIVRELLINIWKHAEVSGAQVQVSMDAASGGLVIRVVDAGVGFEVERLLTPSAQNSYGLFSIKERVAFLGGTMRIDSQPGRGTTVMVALAPGGDLRTMIERGEK